MKATPVRTITGPAGAATLVATEIEPGDAQYAATVATWFLHCPRQSPAWEHYLLACVHLRPLPGAPEPKIVRPLATHEFLVVALDPAEKPRPDDVRSWAHLTPVNVAEQLLLASDVEARQVVALAAQLVVHGALPAEPLLSGQREPWRSTLRLSELLVTEAASP